MPSYLEQIENRITSIDPSANEVLIELFKDYIEESKKLHRKFHHVLVAEAMLLRLNSISVPSSDAAKMEAVIQKLNALSVVPMNKNGHFLSLFNAFFAFYPFYLQKLLPVMRMRLQTQPFLFAPEADADTTINALNQNYFFTVSDLLADALVDLIPVTPQELQRKIILRLLTTTDVTQLLRSITFAPENYHPEIVSRLLTLLDSLNGRFPGAPAIAFQAERLSIINMLGERASVLQGNIRTKATFMLLSYFEKDDLLLNQAAADSLYQIILKMPQPDKERMLNNIRQLVLKYVTESVFSKFKTIILMLLKFTDLMHQKFENTTTLIKLHADFHAELENIDLIREKITAFIISLPSVDKTQIIKNLLEDLNSSNPKIIAKLQILKGISKLLSSHHRIVLHTCFERMFREYNSLSTPDGLIELCEIYEKISKDSAEAGEAQSKIKSMLLPLLNHTSHIETGSALVKTYLSLELMNMGSHTAISFLYSAIIDQKSHYLFVSGCCDVIGAYALKHPDQINQILVALSNCLQSHYIQVKTSACGAIDFLAEVINTNNSYHATANTGVENLLFLTTQENPIIKIKAYAAVGKLIKFIPEEAQDSLIDSGIDDLSPSPEEEILTADFCDALTGFMPFVKYDPDNDESPKKRLLTALVRLINTSTKEKMGNVVLNLFSHVAGNIPEPLMTQTSDDLIQLFYSPFPQGRKRSLQALLLLAPHCNSILKSKLATHLVRQLNNEENCQLAQTVLKSLNPLAANTQGELFTYILDRVFKLENSRSAAAMSETLINLTEDCASDLMLTAIKRAMAQLNANNKLNVAHDVLLKLADTVSKNDKYKDLKSHFVNEYIKAQRNKDAPSKSYFTYVSIIAKFYAEHSKANAPRAEMEVRQRYRV